MNAPSVRSVRFEWIRTLGAGGMGVVHEVVDRDSGERLALKTLTSLEPRKLSALKKEFRSLQGLAHPNLVSLGELIEEEGQWFLTMELVEGQDFLSYVCGRLPEPRATPFDPATVTMAESPTGELAHASPRPPSAPHAFDEARLRSSLGQLALGLCAIHAAGKVHCDIKPSNILVRADGHLVLLDFGLVTDPGDALPGQATKAAFLGTPAYVAPEQAAEGAVDAAVDWYGAGVVLFQALTGQVPFRGTALQMVQRKQLEPAPDPRTFGGTLPEDLATLCLALLERDPAKRPTGAQVLARLGLDARLGAVAMARAPFVGREEELARLQRALARSREGATAVLVEGESGMGKTTLVRHFVEQLDSPDLLLLRGRCYEREAVTFKAFDGVMDQLAARLRGLELEALFPVGREVLASAFPVLTQLPALSGLEAAAALGEAQERRSRLFQALRELFTRLARRHTVVITIDDLQWADADSLLLLRELLRQPEAPALLLVGTLRTLPTTRAPLGERAEHLLLRSLEAKESQALAALLLRESGAKASEVAAEAGGHPLFIQELARYWADAGARAPQAPVQLDEAIAARTRDLDPGAAALLELVAVMGGPTSLEVCASATGVEQAELRRQAATLRAGNLVWASGARQRDALEPYHDRIREAVTARLTPPRRRACHQALAQALNTHSPEAHEALATHWHGAGELPRAADHALRAADRAVGALAFHHAAQRYRSALQWAPPTGAAELALREKLGEALVNAGQAEEGAAELLTASALELRPGPARDLKRRAAEQLLRSGSFDRGLELMRETVTSAGMRFPTTPKSAFLSFLWSLARLKLRGMTPSAPAPDGLPEALRNQIDLCWSVAVGFALVEPVRAWDFQARHLRLALDAGDPRRIARALALELSWTASTGRRSWADIQQLAATARELTRDVADPYVTGMILAHYGAAARLCGEFKEAHALLKQAEQLLSEQCVGVEWDLTAIRLFLNGARLMRGEWGELSRIVPALVQRATERQDRFGAIILAVGYINLAWLVRDEPDEAQRQVEDAIRHWSRRGFHLEHALALYALAQADLYRGEPERAHERLSDIGQKLRGSLLSRIKSLVFSLTQLRCRAAIAAAARPGAEPKWQAAAETDLAALSKRPLHGYEGEVELLAAGLSAVKGDGARALQQLAQAEALLSNPLQVAAAQWRRGAIAGGTDGARQVAQARAAFTAQQVKRPEAMVALLTPGWAKPQP